MEEITGIVGRDREAVLILEALDKGSNVLVRGRPGIGKSTLVRHCYQRTRALGHLAVLVPSSNPKQMTLSIMEQLHEQIGLVIPGAILGPRLRARARREGRLAWEEMRRTLFRLPVLDAATIIIETMKKELVTVFVQGLEVSAQKADLLGRIIEVGLMAAAIEDNNRRVRIERMMWRFQTVIELKPLPIEVCEQIARTWLEKRSVRFSDTRTRQRFIRHVAQDSGGVPAAIRGMLEAAEKEDEVTPAKARAFTHAAGVQYLDMTPILVLALVAALAARYISRGIGDTDMLVLSGVASALFMGLRFFFWQMRAR